MGDLLLLLLLPNTSAHTGHQREVNVVVRPMTGPLMTKGPPCSMSLPRCAAADDGAFSRLDDC
jgi:hypothetical protein